ncbi:AAA family ATPase [Candidatus Micrarchaeota archaeon]|nr:AAA family ATPase [Candidatus Micrarchaeota archaeon]MBU1931038.1 AAA family ATPase [Candidatus Micrarchaeota archaeon]
MAVERAQTGIPGLDELIQGGIPRGASVVVAGGTGTGKSIMAMEFIYNGALQFNEPGVFVTIETNKQNLLWDMENFNWDLKKMQDNSMLKIERLKFMPGADMEQQVLEQLKIIAKLVKSINAKRLVIDSTTALGIWISDKGVLRNTLFRFLNALKEIGCTTILTAETKGHFNEFSSFGVEEFVADAVIALYLVPPNRSIFVRKMRGTKHSKRIHPLDIDTNGLTIKPKDEILWQSLR